MEKFTANGYSLKPIEELVKLLKIIANMPNNVAGNNQGAFFHCSRSNIMRKSKAAKSKKDRLAGEKYFRPKNIAKGYINSIPALVAVSINFTKL
jgi:hypothetical protein